MAPASARLYFAAHVHVCRTEDYVILLDTRRNEFLGIEHSEMDALSSVLRGEAPLNQAKSLVESLLANGMLATSEGLAPQAEYILPTRALHEGFVPFRQAFSLRQLLRFLGCSIRARIALARGDIESTIERSNRHTAAARSSLDVDRLGQLMAAYVHCRAWVWSAEGSCLLDSLTVHGFLARSGVRSSLVVGVRSCPFAAHAWVQVGNTVVNDRPDVIRAYHPIYWSPVSGDA
jgi:hypothetical protein